MNSPWRRLPAPRYLPLIGGAVGAVGGAVYWVSAQFWPTSVAVILAMFATATLTDWLGVALTLPASRQATAPATSPSARVSPPYEYVFAVFIKFNLLMALSAANLPFPLPANLALGLILIAGLASSSALAMSMKPAPPVDLLIALAIGFAPAALIGLPGLIGLAGAIAARIAFAAYTRGRRRPIGAGELDTTRRMTELCFYLGALAAWSYI